MTPVKYLTILGLLLAAVCLCEAKKSDKIRLEKVQTLTLQADQWTTGRRSAPIKQLSCVGGYCGKARVTAAQCYNRGFDGRDVQWECKAEMPANYKFGRIEVICEGYDYPEDEYVLVGSCGMEYTIDGTGDDSTYSKPYYSPQSTTISKDSSSGYWPIIVIVALIALIYFTCLRDPNPNNAYSSTSSSDDYPRPSAPPPPGFRTDYFDSSDSCSRGAGTSRGASASSGGPGLFSGLAAGGLLGYLFGSSRSNNTSRTYSRPYTSSSSGWDYGGPSTSGTSSRSESSETRTSSGFGSTRRR